MKVRYVPKSLITTFGAEARSSASRTLQEKEAAT